MISLELKNGDIIEVEKGISAADVTKKISMGLFRAATSVKINGELKDLRTKINENSSFEILTFDDKLGKEAYWHTASHVLAQAVKRLFPDVKLAIGPAIDDGYYYDIDRDMPFSDEDLEKIEIEMAKIIKEKLDISNFSLPADEAIKLMKEKNEDYKVELIENLKDLGEEISFYEQGEFVDLCAGPHLLNTGDLKSIKLLQTTGAYWRGDSENQMLSRIYGTAFPKKSMLDEYLHMIEEAKNRDHKKLGRELELFTFLDVGPGLPFFLPKGKTILNILIDFWRKEHVKAGYEEIQTPLLLNKQLWERSGHWDHYKDNMYITKIEDTEFALKPMNCPGAILVFNNKIHSYRDLPRRIGELGIVHRHEPSGTLNGLKRARSFTQDDAHIFMLQEQIKDEVKGVINLMDKFYNVFGFKYHIELSTRPEDSMGTDEEWDEAIRFLKESLNELDREYIINEGDGAFYGPKIDIHIKDALNRTWQCATIQLDFQMPQRFDVTYIGEDGEKHRPVMLHRVILGSIERFIAVLIEHTAGALPLWISPIQVRVLPVSEKYIDYAKKINEKFIDADIRSEVDLRNEKLGYKIREAQAHKVPYFVIVGENEMNSNSISVRKRSEQKTQEFNPDELIEKISNLVNEKSLYL